MRPRTLIALAIAVHAALLLLATLPASRFARSVAPLYERYVQFTNQPQSWVMYQNPDQVRSNYELLAIYADGHVEKPWGSSKQMHPRNCYFIEALLCNPSAQQVAWDFLGVLRERMPENSRPQQLLLRRTSRLIVPYEQSINRSPLGDEQAPVEIRRVW